ncbi:MAG: hypothetical protein MUE95_06545 [Cyclobacteriaceae bacterium]|jgi:hypothetical protein|nr:hypothetical protein [Cyclobacteriaceae bacterium]
MDLQRAWKKLETERLEQPLYIPLSGHPRKLHSRHPAIKMKNGLYISLAFTVAFLAVFVLLFFRYDPWLIKFFTGLMVGVYIFFGVYNFITLNRLNEQLKMAFAGSLKDSLVRIHSIIHQSIRYQERVALFIYPLSAIAGFLMGVGEHDNFEQNIQQPKMLMVLAVAIVIATPLCYWMARWMYKITYDKYLDQLKALIRDMEVEG